MGTERDDREQLPVLSGLDKAVVAFSVFVVAAAIAWRLLFPDPVIAAKIAADVAAQSVKKEATALPGYSIGTWLAPGCGMRPAPVVP
jgi:hypothetical protein